MCYNYITYWLDKQSRSKNKSAYSSFNKPNQKPANANISEIIYEAPKLDISDNIEVNNSLIVTNNNEQ